MKSLGFALFCLLCTVAWAQLEDEQLEDDFEPLFISAFDEDDGTYGLVMTKVKALIK